MVVFDSHDDVETWAQGQTPEARAAFAARAALRVLPDFTGQPSTVDPGRALLSLRAMLTASVRSAYKSEAVGSAAKASASASASFSTAADTAFAASTSAALTAAAAAASAAASASADPALAGRWAVRALQAAISSSAASAAAKVLACAAAASSAASSADDPAAAALAALFAARAVSEDHDGALWQAMSSDATDIERYGPVKIFTTPLWPPASPPGLGQAHLESSNSLWDSDPQTWAFWRDWHQGILDGRAPDWELWHVIALIPGADWDQGPAHVAHIIARLQVMVRTSIAAPLVWDDARSVLVIAAEPPLPGDVMRFATERIRLALDAAVLAGAVNGFNQSSSEAYGVRTALERHSDEPSLLATAFWDAALSLAANIGDRYPEDQSLINFRNALWTVTDEICEQDESARQRCLRLSQLAQPRELRPTELPLVTDMVEVVVPHADPHATAVIRWYAKAVEGPLGAVKWVRARFLNLLTSAANILDRLKRTDDRIGWLVQRISDLFDWFQGN